MIGHLKRATCSLLLLLLTVPCHAGPDDVVPRGAATYDFLGSLAATGRLKGFRLSDFARGDRLYTRREIARILLANAENLAGDSQDEPFVAVRRALFVEYAPEFRLLGKPLGNANSALPARNADSVGSAKARFLSGPAQGAGTLRLATTAPVGRDGIAVISGGNWRNEWYDATPSLSTAARGLGSPFFQQEKEASGTWTGRATGQGIENAFLRVNGRVFDVSLGLIPLRWGPGYTGGLLLSDESSTIPQVRLEKAFRLPGRVGRRLGTLAFTQVYGQFFEANDPTAPEDARGTRRNLAARRLESAGEGRFHLSLAEGYKSTRLPDPLFSQILPFYWYQNDWTTYSNRHLLSFLVSDPLPDTNWFNYFADVNLSYRADGRGTILYADYALDDIKAPGPFRDPKNQNTPRKLAQQYGIYVPDLGGIGRYGLRLEYTTSDSQAYTNDSAPIAWSNNNVPLGFPGGPNARLLFARLETRLSDKCKVAFEGQTRRRGVTLPNRNEPNVTRYGVYSSYDLRSNLFLGGRYEYQKNMPQSGTTTKQSRFELNIGTGF